MGKPRDDEQKPQPSDPAHPEADTEDANLEGDDDEDEGDDDDEDDDEG